MSGCAICQRQAEREALAVYADERWLARHSQETDILGYLVLESRRHFLDLSEAHEAEAASLGGVLSLLMRAMRSVVECQRIYSFTLAEAVPHFHVHLIPRTDSLPRAFRGRGILAYPTEPAADAALVEETCRRLRAAVKRSEW